MPIVNLTLPHQRYDIIIEPGALSRLGPLVREVAAHPRAAIIADAAVESTHGRAAAQSMQAADYAVTTAVMPSGEQHKNLGAYQRLLDQLLDAGLERKSPVVAVGGGITGDTVGFVASTYLRGVPFIQCPTTLLAMVDASVGGKVGVNVPQGKNLVGAFYQPRRVVIDIDTLQTLPLRDLRCGLAECLKHGMVRDQSLFDWTTQHAGRLLKLDSRALIELVERNVAVKAAVVMEDEKEAGVRAHLNFGHSFAHAIEATTGYRAYRHGEAVALGMVAATHLACDTGRCPASVLDRLLEALDAVNLPTTAADLADKQTLLASMRSDKKVSHGRIRLVLPMHVGEVTITNEIDDAAIAGAWDAIRR